ncbi:hypothetical protein SLS58_007186 [Diplodia intermedia]|uniref:Uncharacterized protein n=1 Tax=Diplodia intermedia TaxID=856260 RepID=A0ABR3TL90_9PEZI
MSNTEDESPRPHKRISDTHGGQPAGAASPYAQAGLAQAVQRRTQRDSSASDQGPLSTTAGQETEESDEADLAQADPAHDMGKGKGKAAQVQVPRADLDDEEPDSDQDDEEPGSDQSSEIDEEPALTQAQAESQEDDMEVAPETQQTFSIFVPPMQQAAPIRPSLTPNVFREKLQKGYHHLASYAWKKDASRIKPIKASLFKQKSCDEWIKICIPILAAIPIPILLEIMGGNLLKAKIENRDGVAKMLRPNEQRLMLYKGNDAPRIYHVLLTNKVGDSPTANEFTEVIGKLRKYPDLTEFQVAHDLDRMVGPDEKGKFTLDAAKRGERRYLSDPNNPSFLKPHRVRNLEHFCDALEARIRRIPPAERDEPLEAPLRYFGYGNSFKRTQAYQKHESSNYIMSLVDAACKLLFKENSYGLQGCAIYWCTGADDCVASEILLTTIGDGYIEDGGGFRHEPAGSNNSSGKALGDNVWEQAAKWTLKHTPFGKNIELYKEILKEEAKLPQQLADIKAKKAEVIQKRDAMAAELKASIRASIDESRAQRARINAVVDIVETLSKASALDAEAESGSGDTSP